MTLNDSMKKHYLQVSCIYDFVQLLTLNHISHSVGASAITNDSTCVPLSRKTNMKNIY